jgi:hypothetical protein
MMTSSGVSRRTLVSGLVSLLAASALLAAVSPLYLQYQHAGVTALEASRPTVGKFFETVTVDHKAVAAAATLSNHNLKHVTPSAAAKLPVHVAFLAHHSKPLAIAKSILIPVEDSEESADTLRDIKRADSLVGSSATILRKSESDFPVRSSKPVAMRASHSYFSRPMMIRGIQNGFHKPMSSKFQSRTQQLVLKNAPEDTSKPVRLSFYSTGYSPQTFDAPTSLHPASGFMKASDPNQPAGLNAAAGYSGFQQQNRYYDEHGNYLPDDLAPPSDNVNMRPPSDLPQWQTGYNQPPLFESDGGGGSIDSLGNNDNEQYPVQRSDLPYKSDSYNSNSPVPFHT